MSKKQLKIINKDDILYLEKSKTCLEIYYDLFKRYFLNLICCYTSEARNKIFELYNSQNKEKINSQIKKLFLKLYKNVKLIPSKIGLVNNFPNCPFILFLKNEKYNVNELIPINNNIKYNEILKVFYDGINFEKNKYNQISQYNQVQTNNNDNNEKEENINNDDGNEFSDYVNKILSDYNSNNNNNENNKNIKKEEEKKGLKGGNENDNEESTDSDKDSVQTDNNENENEI